MSDLNPLSAQTNATATAQSPSVCPFHKEIDNKSATDTHTNGCPMGQVVENFDPFEDGYQQDPAQYVKWSRDAKPVFYSPKLGYWIVTRYDDIKHIFRDNITFSPAIALEKITPTVPEATAVLSQYDYAMNRTLVNEDEPAHMARRRLLMSPFSPDALKHHEPMVRQLVKDYVDKFIDTGRADLVDDMLWEVPLTVALHFLGVPEEDMDKLREYSIAHTVNTWGRPQPHEQIAVAHTVGKFWQLAGNILEKMRKNPTGEGWMQYGIRKQQEHPEIVTDSYLHSMMMAGIVAAHETTANAAANAIKILLENRAAWEQICQNPSLIQNTVEECLRYNGSVAAWRRIATCDTQIGKVAIPQGAKLLMILASANHDERQFVEPDVVDIHRPNASDQLTFGYGAHQCLGKNLARMEIQIILEELTRRLPHMVLAKQDFSYVANTSFRGPEHLWVEWNPKLNPENTDKNALVSRLQVKLGEPKLQFLSRKMVVSQVSKPNHQILHLTLIPADSLPLPAWQAGAHIDVHCGETGITRQYSLCGDPKDRSQYQIAIARDPNSRGGSSWLHDHLQLGDTVTIKGPRNHFHFLIDVPKAIFIAGGIGITPIIPMALEAKRRNIDYEIHYSSATKEGAFGLEQLRAEHGDRLNVYISDTGNRNDFARLLATPDKNTRIYACGSPRLLETLQHCTQHWQADSLIVEHFTNHQNVQANANNQDFYIALKRSAKVLPVLANQTILNVLEEAHIPIESTCREGLCGACEVMVLDGHIAHRDLVLNEAERAKQNRMMTCCSRSMNGETLVLDL